VHLQNLGDTEDILEKQDVNGTSGIKMCLTVTYISCGAYLCELLLLYWSQLKFTTS
jgi:hypothetical protein